MRKALLGLTLAAVAGYVAWIKFQPPPARLAAALDEARKENKLVLLDFTGSDWCGWCMKLEAESLGKPEFLNYASKYLVTLVVDFPMRHELPADLKKQNKALKSRYEVEGFPTLIALSPEGKVVWKQSGFIEGGPWGVIAPINRNRVALGLPEPGGAVGSAATVAMDETAPGKASVSTPPVAVSSSAKQGLPPDAPKLQGLLYSRSNPCVILGGKQCGVGDSTGGMRVVKILQDRVIVEWEGRTEELTMQ